MKNGAPVETVCRDCRDYRKRDAMAWDAECNYPGPLCRKCGSENVQRLVTVRFGSSVMVRDLLNRLQHAKIDLDRATLSVEGNQAHEQGEADSIGFVVEGVLLPSVDGKNPDHR